MDISFLIYLNFLLFSSPQIVLNNNRFNSDNQNPSQFEKEEFLNTTDDIDWEKAEVCRVIDWLTQLIEEVPHITFDYIVDAIC